MGFLFRHGPPLPQQQVYANEDAKWRAVPDRLRRALADGRIALVVAHFRDTIQHLAGLLAGAGVPWTGFDRLPAGRPAADQVVLLPASAFAGAIPADQPAGGSGDSAEGLLVELHPARGHDEHVIRCLWALPFPVAPVRCCSLDDPVLCRFSGPALRNLLRRLGASEDEPIASSLIDHAITRARAKLADLAPDDRPHDNAESWLRDNLDDRR